MLETIGKRAYATPQHHVNKRPHLPDALRSGLTSIKRADWPKHPGYYGLTSTLLSVHKALTGGARQLSEAFEIWSKTPRSKVQDALMASRLKMAGRDLVRFAHGHHYKEDRELFPYLSGRSPALKKAVALLAADHKVLDAALDDLKAGLDAMDSQNISQAVIDETGAKAKAVSAIISRHIVDEEEIVIPIFLKEGF